MCNSSKADVIIRAANICCRYQSWVRASESWQHTCREAVDTLSKPLRILLILCREREKRGSPQHFMRDVFQQCHQFPLHACCHGNPSESRWRSEQGNLMTYESCGCGWLLRCCYAVARMFWMVSRALLCKVMAYWSKSGDKLCYLNKAFIHNDMCAVLPVFHTHTKNVNINFIIAIINYC